jgi:hypothetical protein
MPVAPAVSALMMPSAEDRVLADLHWLIQDGYVVEFSDGRLWALPDKPPQPVSPAAPRRGDRDARRECGGLTESRPESPLETAPVAGAGPGSLEGGEPNPSAPAAS